MTSWLTATFSTTPFPCHHGAGRLRPGQSVAVFPKPACSSPMSQSQTLSCEIKGEWHTYWVLISMMRLWSSKALLSQRLPSAKGQSCCHSGLMWHPHLFFFQTASLGLMEKLSNRPDRISSPLTHLPSPLPFLWWLRDFNGLFYSLCAPNGFKALDVHDITAGQDCVTVYSAVAVVGMTRLLTVMWS